MTDDEVLSHMQEAFDEGFLTGLAGLPGNVTTIETSSGPVEGVRVGDTITFDLPDGRVLQVHLQGRGNLEAYMDGRLVARIFDDPDVEDDPQGI